MKQTKKKINSISANYVTTNTAQTITGKKTLTTTNKNEVIAVKVTNTDNTVTPTENLWTNVISAYDKNTKTIIDYINEFESDDLSIVLKEKYETYLKA